MLLLSVPPANVLVFCHITTVTAMPAANSSS
jgi:hypothetical protein